MKVSTFYKNGKIYESYHQLEKANIPKGFHKKIIKISHEYKVNKSELLFKKVKALTIIGLTSNMLINCYYAHIRMCQNGDFSNFSGVISQEAQNRNKNTAKEINLFFNKVFSSNNPGEIDSLIIKLMNYSEKRISDFITYVNGQLSLLVALAIDDFAYQANMPVFSISPYSVEDFLKWESEKTKQKSQKRTGVKAKPQKKKGAKPKTEFSYTMLTYFFGFSFLIILISLSILSIE